MKRTGSFGLLDFRGIVTYHSSGLITRREMNV
jgi:hypothetical protein